MLILMRHGATASNRATPPRLQGSGVDLPLSDAGRLEAEQASGSLRHLDVGAVFCSTMRRAVETATIVAAPWNLSPASIDGLHEIDVGDWEGMSWSEIRESDPERFADYDRHGGAAAYPGGESPEQVVDRALPVLEDIARSHDDRPLIVAHRAVNRSVIGHLMGVPPERWRHVPQDNTGINVLRWNGSRLKVETVNSTFHLTR